MDKSSCETLSQYSLAYILNNTIKEYLESIFNT